ncbi:MAG TPA: hypothetical protein VFN48_00405 [Solirubrobacteraceae bacterium]|nr:hypothetical protein [Solirubrobacteraceae bacterium]
MAALAATAGVCAACGAAQSSTTSGAAAAHSGGPYFAATTVSVSTTVLGDAAANPKLPAYLPSAAPAPDQIVTATPQHPVRAAIEGNTVVAQLPGARADLTVVGPTVPVRFLNAVHAGHRSQQLPVPASFVASVKVTRGTLRLSAHDFGVLSEDGLIHPPRVTALDGGAPPRTLRAGQHADLKLTVTMIPGDGGVRWSPDARRVLVNWTYVLEVD